MIKKDEIQIRDPFVLTVHKEKKYYLFGTTDKNVWEGKATGFEVYSSSNLEDWNGPFPAFHPSFGFWADKNFWAPEVHYYNGKYYMIASFKADEVCRGSQILISDQPSGPYIPFTNGRITPPQWECLDGTLFVDEQNDPWLIFCHEWVQVNDGEH